MDARRDRAGEDVARRGRVIRNRATTQLRRAGWAVVIILALFAAGFGADSALRSYAQARMQSEIEKALPAGVTVPGLKVTVHGFSFIAQYLGGEFGQVDVDAPAIRTERGTVAAHLVANRVRIDRSFRRAPVLGEVDGTLRVSESAVNGLVALPDPTARIQLGARTVSYLATTEILGLPISYSATVRPVADGTTVQLFPKSVSVTSGPVNFDVKQLLGDLFDGKPIDVCVAPYLPAGLSVGDISIAKGDATIGFHAAGFSLDERTFAAHSKCPAG